MNKEEIFNILYGKETWDIWRKFQEIESSIDESKLLYGYFDDIEKMLFDEKSYIIWSEIMIKIPFVKRIMKKIIKSFI